MATSANFASRLGLPLFACALGLALLFHPTLASGFRRMQNDPGDTRLNNYILEHEYRWATNAPGRDDFWSPRVFHPTENVAAFTESLVGAAPVYWAIRAAGVAPDTAFQLWMIAVAALNFLAAYAFLRRALGIAVAPAAAGAALFAFASARACQLLHQQLLPQFYCVLALHALVRIAGEEPSPRPRLWIAVLAACLALQFYTCFYMAWFFGFGLAIGLAFALVLPAPRARLLAALRANGGALAVAAAALGLALLPLATHYLAAARANGFRLFDEALPMLPRPQSWIYLGPSSWLYGWMSEVAPFAGVVAGYEHRLGLGLVTSALAIAGLARERRRPAVQLAVLVAAAVVLLATVFPGEVTAWKAVYLYVPGAKAVRGVARIGLLLLFPGALGVALFFAGPFAARRPKLAAALALVALAEQGQRLQSFDKIETRARVAALSRAVDRRAEAFLYAPLTRPAPRPPAGPSFLFSELVAPWPAWHDQVDAMWAHLETGVPTLNGYYGQAPPGWRLATHGPPGGARDLEAALAVWTELHGLDRGRICVIGEPP